MKLCALVSQKRLELICYAESQSWFKSDERSQGVKIISFLYSCQYAHDVVCWIPGPHDILSYVLILYAGSMKVKSSHILEL